MYIHLAGGDDFSLDEVTIVVTPPDLNECSPVAVVNDNVREGEETFSVTLSTLDEAVDLRSSTAVVRIQDNDGNVAWNTYSYMCIVAHSVNMLTHFQRCKSSWRMHFIM